MSKLATVVSAELGSRIRFCERIGFEIEGFTPWSSSKGLSEFQGGKMFDEAGENHAEIALDPFSTAGESFDVLRQVHARHPEIQFVPFRPTELMGTENVWHQGSRLDTLRMALDIEKPGHREWLCKLTNRAALHVNFSGQFDPAGDEGAFIVNLMNDLALFFAAKIHDEIGFGHGHLSVWQRFALINRLPEYGRWFKSGADMISYIESTPRLIKRVGDNEYLIPFGELMQVTEPVDMGNLWWFCRLKMDQHGNWYLELRYIPSMPLSLAEYYAQQAIDMLETILNWYHGPNGSQPVISREMAWSGYKYLGNSFPGFVPSQLLGSTEWHRLFER